MLTFEIVKVRYHLMIDKLRHILAVHLAMIILK